jgi:hypothetical protein
MTLILSGRSSLRVRIETERQTLRVVRITPASVALRQERALKIRADVL